MTVSTQKNIIKNIASAKQLLPSEEGGHVDGLVITFRPVSTGFVHIVCKFVTQCSSIIRYEDLCCFFWVFYAFCCLIMTLPV